MKDWIDKFTSFIKKLPSKLYDFNSVEKKVTGSIENHADTLNKLEKYDTGQISKPKKMAQYQSMQDYLRDLQKKSSKIELER
jgi:hypothetical protein